jgi:hypothetical protein
MNQAPQNDQPSTDGTRERVTGPFKGYHVVALGFRIDAVAAGFRGYYKICRGHPGNYWTAESLLDGKCGPLATSGGRAMRMAETAAAAEIDGLAINSPNAGWGYGSHSMLPFLREQREARAGEQFRGDGAQPRSPHQAGALADTKLLDGQ